MVNFAYTVALRAVSRPRSTPRAFSLAIILGALAAPATAQPAPKMAMEMKDAKGPGRAVQGSHLMAATVSNVDHQMGMISVVSDGMTMMLHFPPSSLVGLKIGDKITLHLGFSKP